MGADVAQVYVVAYLARRFRAPDPVDLDSTTPLGAQVS